MLVTIAVLNSTCTMWRSGGKDGVVVHRADLVACTHGSCPWMSSEPTNCHMSSLPSSAQRYVTRGVQCSVAPTLHGHSSQKKSTQAHSGEGGHGIVNPAVPNACVGSRAHDDIILYYEGKRKSVYLPTLAMVKAESFACTIKSTSG